MNLESINSIEKDWLPFLKKYFKKRDLVVDFKLPKELKREIDFSLSETGSKEKLEDILRKVVAHTPNAQHPNFLSYLYSSPDPVGLIGDWLVSLVNSNVHAYEASPVFSVAEVELVKALKKFVGFGKNSDGVFCPGGSYSNFLAMYIAKRRATKNGEKPEKLAVFTSSQSHYSIDKAAALLGISKKNIYKVECDEKGRMLETDLLSKLRGAKNLGLVPFFISATAGTTVLGGFDRISKIKKEISKYSGTWLHVDAAWGGAVLFSKKYKKLMQGISVADSITWDFHKALGAPILCSVVVAKDKRNMRNMFDVEDKYLFHDNAEYEEYEIGQRTPQCGRRGDAFKFWLMWKVYGRKYFEKRVSDNFKNVEKALKLISSRDCFVLHDKKPEYWNVCLWYIPKNMRHKRFEELSRRDKIIVENLTKKIYECIKKDGQILVNYASVKDFPSFLRLILSNPGLNKREIRRVLDVIESLGDMLSSNLEELLVSGGDERLELGENGMNYVFIAPVPIVGQISRSSCTSSRISQESYERLNGLADKLKAAKISFRDCMFNVHERIRNILEVDSDMSVITVPSGTDSEYVPLMIAKAYAGKNKKVVNIITGAGEIGSNSAVAASGQYFNPKTPAGSKVKPMNLMAGISGAEVIEVSQRDSKTGKPLARKRVWQGYVKKKLAQKNTIVLLHILESSKLGYRIDAMDDIKKMLEKYPNRLFIAVDACQSRTDISRVREYLKLGCMVMITGSKFEEAPPFCGAVLAPKKVISPLSRDDFREFPKGLKNFITKHDVSGPIKDLLNNSLRSWMNWGLMLRWTVGLDNWQKYRSIKDSKRNDLIKSWVKGMLKVVEKYPNLKVLSGGEHQSGSVGDINTIISLKMLNNGKFLGTEFARKIYRMMTKDVNDIFTDKELTKSQREALKKSFLLGQPVNLGNYAIIRIALGAGLAVRIDRHGIKKELADDEMLLEKLSFLVKNLEKLNK